MKIALPLSLVLACGAMSSEVALAAHHHRPAAAPAHSGPPSDEGAKSPVAPVEPTGAPPSAAEGRVGDAPIDTSITVNQAHRPLNAREAAEKKITTALGKLTPPKAKPHLPTPPFATHVVPPRDALGAVVAHPAPSHVAVAPWKPAAQPGAAATAPATPTPHEGGGTAVAPTPKSPAMIAAEHSAAVPKTITTNGPGITGTGIAKPWTATTALGGPTKTVTAAAVGGASFHPKHP